MKWIFLLALFACTGKSNTSTVYLAKDAPQFSKFVNQKNMPQDPNLTLDKNIVNNDYPIEIALYKDHRFFYNLPNLGTGKGKWIYNEGKIELRAHRTLFDMYIEVYGGDQDFTQLSIQFTDRFGPNTLKMANQNL